jgi:uncharacterized protein YlaI
VCDQIPRLRAIAGSFISPAQRIKIWVIKGFRSTKTPFSFFWKEFLKQRYLQLPYTDAQVKIIRTHPEKQKCQERTGTKRLKNKELQKFYLWKDCFSRLSEFVMQKSSGVVMNDRLPNLF